MFFGDVHGDAHSQPGFDALDEAIHLYRPIRPDVGGESGSHPERIAGLDKHAVGADITRTGTQNRRTPLDLKIGAVIVTRSPTALRPSWMVSTAHDLAVRPLLRTRIIGLLLLNSDPCLISRSIRLSFGRGNNLLDFEWRSNHGWRGHYVA